MHNLQGRGSAVLDTFSGTVTVAGPTDLPEGASPRNTNCDYNVGSALTRQGLVNPFVYAGNSQGPTTGGVSSEENDGQAIWSNVPNVLLPGFFASTALAPPLKVVSVQGLFHLPGSGPPIRATMVTFMENVPTIFGGQTYTFSGLTVTTTLNGQVLTPDPTDFPFVTPGPNQQIFIFNSGAAVGVDTPDTGVAVVSTQHSASNAIQVRQFGWSVPTSATPQGFQIQISAYSDVPGTLLGLQMLKAGVGVGNFESVLLNVGTPTTVTLGGMNDLFGTGWTYADLNNPSFGVHFNVVNTTQPANVFVGYTTMQIFLLPTQENFNYICTFEDAFGVIRNVALDSSGEFWLENVTTNPGTLTPLFGGPPSGSFASSFTAASRQYFAISDLLQGNYPPQQYTGQWNDRVSQVGPGAPPTFTGIVATGTTYNIATITQPTPVVRTFAFGLWSTGPGSTSPGNVVTQYYQDSTLGGPDTALVAAFNSGFPVYLYVQLTATSIPTPMVVQVTAVGLGLPPTQSRQFFYFTYNIAEIGYTLATGGGGYGITYQQSLATMTMAVPVPGLVIGNIVDIVGASVSAYDGNQTITQTLNSGQMSITATSVTSGVATYNYTLISGTAPVANQTITITGTLNANGQLNFVNAVIVTASGGSSGTFTVNVSSPDFIFAPEQGQATTAGTIFTFDPGAALVGSATSPIHGNSTSGHITFAGSGQFIGPGTRRGTVFFINRDGYWTKPAPPVTFTIPDNTISIQATNIPIGPPNVVMRQVIFTEGGANGVPGANWFTIPKPVQYIVDNVTYTATSFVINDNVSTSAVFTFTDDVLLNAEAVDIQGNNLFQLGELGDSAWCTSYGARTVWGRVRNKIQNFNNLTFDGGYLLNPAGSLFPLGWQLSAGTAAVLPTLLVSPVFGNSYYIHNTTGVTQPYLDIIFQSAYQDWNNVAILQDLTAYSVRVTARIPSSNHGGALIIDLTAFDVGTGFGQTYGIFGLPFSSMTSAMQTYEGTILGDFLNIPPDLVMRVYAQGIVSGADLEIDRIEIFPTEAPTNLTQLTMSYSNNDNESFDLVTGGIDTTTVNTQPANGAFTMHDQLYVVKESSLGYVSDSPNQEPANWNPYKEVSNVAGACGMNAYDVGEEWAVMACQNGLFLFNGGAPVPVQLEIPDIWQAINWNYGHTICVRNDVANRKIYCAVPLATPNPWMKYSVVNSNPTVPNVILMLNYDGIGTIEELMEAMSMRVTMTGKLAVKDLKRKWSIWTIPTPYMGVIKRNELFAEMLFCNGIASSKIYYLGGQQGLDDMKPYPSSYMTYGFIDREKASELPMFGAHNKRYDYYDLLADGGSVTANNLPAQMEFFQNILAAPYPFTTPGGVVLSDPQTNDIENPLNEYCMRLFCEISCTEGWFEISRLSLVGAADKWAPVRGK